MLTPLLFVACNRELAPDRLQPASSRSTASIVVTRPAKLTSIETGRVDRNAQPLRVACSTCHSLRKTAPVPKSANDLRDFHRGLQFRHGTLECAACHAEGAQPELHLADGRRIPMSDAMLLCGQCHGPQLRDYEHGAHGGMTGYWDLSRGPRTRNHCVDCHDPHTPKYVGGHPVFAPRDRFLDPHDDVERATP